MIVELPAEHADSVICEWFARCTRAAAGVVIHPVLQYVPCCTRCAERAEQTVVRWTLV